MAGNTNKDDGDERIIKQEEDEAEPMEGERVLPDWMLKAVDDKQPVGQPDGAGTSAAGEDVESTDSTREIRGNESDTPDQPDDSSQRRRVACKYGESCYRRNPTHKEEFSHPGDEDYALFSQQASRSNETEDDDQRPECQYGTSCYRQNPQHRRDFKHTKPPEPAEEPEAKKPRLRPATAAKKKRAAKEDEYESEGENKYDLEDSFIDNTDEEEEDDEVGEEEEDEDYVPEVDPELLNEDQWKGNPDDAPEVLELLKEARDYLRNKKLHK